MGDKIDPFKSISKERNHSSSLVALAIARYSTSAEEQETVVCFFLTSKRSDYFQEKQYNP